MKKHDVIFSAVQNERDRITPSNKRSASTNGAGGGGGGGGGGSSRKVLRTDGGAVGGDDDQESIDDDVKSRRTTPEPPNQYVETLMKAEAVTKHLRNTVITRTSDQVPSPARLISSGDVMDSSSVSPRNPQRRRPRIATTFPFHFSFFIRNPLCLLLR